MPYCIYLRKSRADLEAEALGAGDTLKRHEVALTALARARGLDVAHVYREIVSGDTIAARPEMQRMLADVERGRWDGVLCMEVERLARGDTIDQGIVAQTFKYTSTLIITPQKVYDPRNDIDEEYFEFSLFMARREYNAIKRRLMAGRMASAREGNYLSPKPTYGYERVRAEGRGARWRLAVKPDEAAVVRSVFDWYEQGIDGRAAGAQAICNRLNALGLRTAEGRAFYPSGIRAMLHNVTYTGVLKWNKRVQRTILAGGTRVTRRVLSGEPIIARGTHEPIISIEQFERVQRRLAERAHTPSVRCDRTPLNPFSGLIVCGVCGRRMQRRAGGQRADAIRCTTPGCPTCAAQLQALESVLTAALAHLAPLGEAFDPAAVEPMSPADAARPPAMRVALEQRIAQLRRQRRRICELLETGVYDVATFTERDADIAAQLADAAAGLEALRDAAPGPRADVGMRVSLLDEYRRASPEGKRRLLGAVIDRIVYRRDLHAHRNGDTTLGIVLEVFLREF